MKRFLLIVFLSVVSLSLSAQQYFVYHLNGSATIITKKKSEAAKRGDSFTKGQVLMLPAKSVVSILDPAGIVIKLDVPGKYSFEDVVAKVKASEQKGLRYLTYVWEQFNSHPSTEPDHMGMKPVGGVSRSDGVVMIFPPDSAIILAKEIRFTWANKDDFKYFTIFDWKGKELVKLTVSDTTISVYPYYSGLQRNTSYNWTVTKTPYEKPNDLFTFILPSKEWEEEYKMDIAEMIALLNSLNDQEYKKKALDELFKKIKVVE